MGFFINIFRKVGQWAVHEAVHAVLGNIEDQFKDLVGRALGDLGQFIGFGDEQAKLRRKVQRDARRMQKATEGIDRAFRKGSRDMAEHAANVRRLSGVLAKRGLFRIEVRTNADDVADRLGARADALQRAIAQATRESGLIVEAEAKRRAPVVTGTTRRGYDMRVVTPMQVQPLVTVRHPWSVTMAFVGNQQPSAKALERGRRPGRMPPPDALVPWVRKRYGIRRREDARRAAYLVARAIARRGLPKRPVLGPALAAKRGQIRELYRTAVRRALR